MRRTWSSFGPANNPLQVGEAVARRIGLKVVLEAHQLRDTVTLPAHQFEWTTAYGVRVVCAALSGAIRLHG